MVCKYICMSVGVSLCWRVIYGGGCRKKTGDFEEEEGAAKVGKNGLYGGLIAIYMCVCCFIKFMCVSRQCISLWRMYVVMLSQRDIGGLIV